MSIPLRNFAARLTLAAICCISSAQADFNKSTGQWEGDVSAQSFAQYCEGQLPVAQTKTFNAELDQAEQALAARKIDAAQDALNSALQAVYRGGAETDISVKCLGEPVARRWQKAQIALWRLAPQSGPQGASKEYTQLYLAAFDGGHDGVVAAVRALPADRFIRAYDTVDLIAQSIAVEREFGAFMLPEETKVEQACRTALAPLQQYAKQQHQAALAAEESAFNRPPTQAEQDAADRLGGISELAQAMAGVDIDSEAQQQILIIQIQVRESRELLEQARGWEISASRHDEQQPSAIRAEQRGDTMLKRANAATLSLQVRNEYYGLARKYFDWCRCHAKAKTAATAQETIQPALRAEQDQRQQKMDTEMQRKSEAMQKAASDMQKSEAEKQSFKDEADALEAELGF